MGRMGFYFDAVNCIGCRTCQIACKDKNALPVGMLFRRVVTVEAGRFPEGHSSTFPKAAITAKTLRV